MENQFVPTHILVALVLILPCCLRDCHKGNRTASEHIPINAAVFFTGTGLVEQTLFALAYGT